MQYWETENHITFLCVSHIPCTKKLNKIHYDKTDGVCEQKFMCLGVLHPIILRAEGKGKRKTCLLSYAQCQTGKLKFV